MTIGNPQPLGAHAPVQNFTTQNHTHEPAPPAAPTKRDLASWWKNFKRNTKKEDENKGMCIFCDYSNDIELLSWTRGEDRIRKTNLPHLDCGMGLSVGLLSLKSMRKDPAQYCFPFTMQLLTLSLHVGPQIGGIFGVPLNVSIKYANVAISLTNDKGESFIYGYVPIVVAKCGVFLKDQGISSINSI